MMHTYGGRRPIAAGMAAAMVVSLAALQSGSPAHADDSPLPGITLVVPASDVTDTDTDLASVAREVVVVAAGPNGPQVTKLRTRSAHDARVLAADLDAQSGVSAGANSLRSAPEPISAHDSAVRRASIDLPAPAAIRSAALPTLAGEPLGSQQWGLRAVNAEAAWAVTRGSGVIVAVVDSGVDATHPDLAGHVRPQIDLVADGLVGDPDGHGTHVAGVIAAALNGVGSVGLAHQVTVLPVRVLDADGAGDDATVAQGIIAAVNAGARVINLSLGGDGPSSALDSAVKFAVDRGITVVAAGGNSYDQGNPVEYPAALPGVLAVSSIGTDGASSSFANTGWYIDLTAPGEDIVSTIPGGRWAVGDGTSMAAPFVSAAAALVRVANPTLAKSAVDSALLSTARDDEDADGRDDWFGYGLLQADRAALQAARAPGGLQAPVAPTPTPTPTPKPKPTPTASVKVKATSGRSKLFVDVNPNKGSGHWRFQVQSKRSNGSWKALKSYRTKGSAETRTLNLKRGTYRVVVTGKYGYRGVTSRPVFLKK